LGKLTAAVLALSAILCSGARRQLQWQLSEAIDRISRFNRYRNFNVAA